MTYKKVSRLLVNIIFISFPLLLYTLFSCFSINNYKEALKENFNFKRNADHSLFYKKYVKKENILTITNPYNKKENIKIDSNFNEYPFQDKFLLKYLKGFNTLFFYESYATEIPTKVIPLKNKIEHTDSIKMLKEALNNRDDT
ncbi:hypothetical protein SLOPH_918, partial [Spraguea lophii 42_110]